MYSSSSCSQESFAVDIDTLLHAGQSHRHEDDDVFSFMPPVAEPKFPTFVIKNRHQSTKQTKASSAPLEESRQLEFGVNTLEDDLEDDVHESVTVCGTDIGDLPTRYTVHDLKPDEFPVIGTYVDRRLVPGFRYHVRKLGNHDNGGGQLFQGRALTLLSIGMGYGKRITFQGEMLNSNSNYFYSDTHNCGYGFRINCVEAGNVFSIRDSDLHVVGTATVTKVHVQREINTETDLARNVMKKVAVSFECTIDYSGQPHGLMPLYSPEQQRLSGIAIVQRNGATSRATTTYIGDVELGHHSLVTFHA